MFKHILLPTDGTELSEKAIDQGLRLAKTIGAKVTSLSVVVKLPGCCYHARISHAALEEAERQSQAAAETYLQSVQERAKKVGIDCDVVLERDGAPYKSIIRMAEQRGCDLIMMASHGQKGIEGVLLGSETQKVLTHSKIPVLVVR